MHTYIPTYMQTSDTYIHTDRHKQKPKPYIQPTRQTPYNTDTYIQISWACRQDNTGHIPSQTYIETGQHRAGQVRTRNQADRMRDRQSERQTE